MLFTEIASKRIYLHLMLLVLMKCLMDQVGMVNLYQLHYSLIMLLITGVVDWLYLVELLVFVSLGIASDTDSEMHCH